MIVSIILPSRQRHIPVFQVQVEDGTRVSYILFNIFDQLQTKSNKPYID